MSRAQEAVQDRSYACLTGEERILASLTSWRYPDARWESDTVAALAAARGTVKLLGQRLGAWQDAFRSLYFALRHGHCNAFYLMTPEVSRQGGRHSKRCEGVACTMVAMWVWVKGQGSSVGGCPAQTAWLVAGLRLLQH